MKLSSYFCVLRRNKSNILQVLNEEFEDTKGVIRISNSKENRQYNGQTIKDRQYNGQKIKDRKYNGQKIKDRQYNGQKIKDRQYNGQKIKTDNTMAKR